MPKITIEVPPFPNPRTWHLPIFAAMAALFWLCRHYRVMRMHTWWSEALCMAVVIFWTAATIWILAWALGSLEEWSDR